MKGCKDMIRELKQEDLKEGLEVIRRGFMTVAEQFNLTEKNSPTFGAFITEERLQYFFDQGSLMFGYFSDGIMAGFSQLYKKSEDVYELQKLAVLPEYRHRGIGKELLNYAAAKVKELGGSKITIGIIEENTVLKNWYLANGFIHTGTKKFDHLVFTAGFMEMEIQ
jgi:ribosomal protein S18 acetylase RimI-like enzyme